MPRSARPERLQVAGRALWDTLVADYEFGSHELALLALACRQADDVAALEEVLERDGFIVPGSNGQPKLTAVVAELRQGRLAMSKLLDQLALPADDEPVGRTPASRRAQKAARARWDRVARMEDHRGTA